MSTVPHAFGHAPARQAPKYAGIGMTAARYGCLEGLPRAQLDTYRVWRQYQHDVAGDVCRTGFRRVRVARRRDLHRRWRRQIRRRGINARRRDRSDSRAPTRNAIQAPTHACIVGVRHRGGECHLISEHDRSGWRCHAHSDGRRRWWRRGDCASSAAAQCPCSRREKGEKTNSRLSETRCATWRKGPHAPRRAGEGPAKRARSSIRT